MRCVAKVFVCEFYICVWVQKFCSIKSNYTWKKRQKNNFKREFKFKNKTRLELKFKPQWSKKRWRRRRGYNTHSLKLILTRFAFWIPGIACTSPLKLNHKLNNRRYCYPLLTQLKSSLQLYTLHRHSCTLAQVSECWYFKYIIALSSTRRRETGEEGDGQRQIFSQWLMPTYR